MESRDDDIQNIEINYTDLDYEQDKAKWNYLGVLLKLLPEDRNMFTHGTSMAYPPSIFRFEIVSEILNQIYPEGNTA